MNSTELTQNIFEFINSLEISQIIILLIIIGFLLLCIKFKKEGKAVLKALTHKYLLISFIGMIIWGILCIMLLNTLRLWDYSLIKDTIFVMIFYISFLVFTSYKILEKKNYIKEIIMENITISAFLVLIINLSVDIIVKTISAIVFIVCGLLIIISQNKEELIQIKTFAKAIIILIVILLFTFSIFSLLSSPENLVNILFGYNTIISFLWPIVLIIMFLPYFYIVALCDEYLKIYNTISIFKNSGLSKKILKVLFSKCYINLWKLYQFRKRLDYINSKSSEKDILTIFKLEKLEFELEDGCIYLNKELVGKYENGDFIPILEKNVNKSHTKYNKIPYVVDYRESSYNASYNNEKYLIGYFCTSNHNIIKIYLLIDTKYTPSSLWSTLIEQINNDQ